MARISPPGSAARAPVRISSRSPKEGRRPASPSPERARPARRAPTAAGRASSALELGQRQCRASAPAPRPARRRRGCRGRRPAPTPPPRARPPRPGPGHPTAPSPAVAPAPCGQLGRAPARAHPGRIDRWPRSSPSRRARWISRHSAAHVGQASQMGRFLGGPDRPPVGHSRHLVAQTDSQSIMPPAPSAASLRGDSAPVPHPPWYPASARSPRSPSPAAPAAERPRAAAGQRAEALGQLAAPSPRHPEVAAGSSCGRQVAVLDADTRSGRAGVGTGP